MRRTRTSRRPGSTSPTPVSTADALARDGAAEAALVAADELGAPGVLEEAATSTVPCDGDGTSGYRVQAMYVVEVGKPNRYAELLPSLKTWAAGAGTVVNRSAALTGGVRDVRWVHEAGTGACQPVVLNVTVPAGSMAGFGQTISAVQAQGYTSPTRKYLMWADANVLCGIANKYPTTSRARATPTTATTRSTRASTRAAGAARTPWRRTSSSTTSAGSSAPPRTPRPTVTARTSPTACATSTARAWS